MRVFALAALLCFISLSSFAADIKFPPLTGRVVDEMHVLSPQATAELTQELAVFEQQTGDQVVVAVVASLQGQEIEDYGYQLGRFWGIGQKGKNNGAILIVAPKERKVRIEVGYGLEGMLTDAQSNDIIYQKIIPQFKAGDIQQGIVAGTEAILSALGNTQTSQNAVGTSQPMPAPHHAPGGNFAVLIPLILFVLLRLMFGIWFIPLGFGFRGSSFGSGGGGGFSGGGGSFGGGGASGSW